MWLRHANPPQSELQFDFKQGRGKHTVAITGEICNLYANCDLIGYLGRTVVRKTDRTLDPSSRFYDLISKADISFYPNGIF